jgi:hypothetical protein
VWCPFNYSVTIIGNKTGIMQKALAVKEKLSAIQEIK